MKTKTVSCIEDLYVVVDHLRDFSSGDQLYVEGKFSKTLSKAFNAYHKTIGSRAKARLAAGATFGALSFGPVGWLVDE